jgi:hypothetical protein
VAKLTNRGSNADGIVPTDIATATIIFRSREHRVAESIESRLHHSGWTAESMSYQTLDTLPEMPRDGVVCLLLSDEMSDSDQSELLLRASGSVAGRLLPVFLAESPRVVIPSGVLRPCKVMDIVDSPESITERVVSRCAQWQVGVLAAYSLNLASQVAMLSEGQSKVRSSIGSLERLVILPNFEVPRHESLLLLGDLPTSLAGKSVLVRLDLDMAGDVREGRHHFKIRRAAKTVSELLERGATVRILASQGISAVAAYEQSAVHACTAMLGGSLRRWMLPARTKC